MQSYLRPETLFNETKFQSYINEFVVSFIVCFRRFDCWSIVGFLCCFCRFYCELTIPGISRYESNGIIASLISIGNKILAGKNTTKEIKKFEDENKMTYQQALDPLITPPENVSATADTWIVSEVAAVLASCMIQNTSLSTGREGAAYTLGRFTPTTVGADSILRSGRAPMMGRTDPVFMRRPLVGCILN